MTIFSFLKTFFSTTRKCVKYFALGLTLEESGNESYKEYTIKLTWNVDLGNLLQLTYCHYISFFFCIKKIFHSENIQYAYNFYWTDWTVCKYKQRRIRNPVEYLRWSFLEKIIKNFIADVPVGCKYLSGISFIVEKQYRISVFA